MQLLKAETEKYKAAWSHPTYRKESPGEKWVKRFQDIVMPPENSFICDFGCGEGRGGKALEKECNVHVTYMDFVRVSGVPKPFFKQPLWKPLKQRFDYGYCCDVMEHIPEQFTMLCVDAMLVSLRGKQLDRPEPGLFMSINFEPDNLGVLVGAPLHLTVKPFVWWRDSLREICKVIEAIDMQGEGIFYVTR